MAEREETGYTDLGGDDAFPLAPRNFDSPLDGDDLARRIVKVTYPPVMLVAGMLWILTGVCYFGLFGLQRLFRHPFSDTDFWLLFGAFFFTKDGVQLIRGKFGDPKVPGIISIVIGVFFVAMGWDFDNPVNVIASVLYIGFGMLFLGAGILVLVGRKKYVAWKVDQMFGPGLTM